MSTTILVSGGAGYVGSHACKALHAAGYQPVTYDNLSRGHEWAVQWGPFEAGDPPSAVADATLATLELGWRPRHASLEPILESAWRWLQHGSAAIQARANQPSARRR